MSPYEVTSEEQKTPKYTIGDVLPYPITKKEGKCTFCDTDYNMHHYMDFFLVPEHGKAILDFCHTLTLKLVTTKTVSLQLSKNNPKHILSPKEIQLQLIEKADTPKVANQIIQQSIHYALYEQIDYMYRNIKENLLSVREHFMGKTTEWELEYEEHKDLLGAENVEFRTILEQATVNSDTQESKETSETAFYNEFLQVHEKDAQHDYHYIQKFFSKINADIEAHVALANEYAKESDPLDTAAALNERKYLDGGGSSLPRYITPMPYGYSRQRLPRRPDE